MSSDGVHEQIKTNPGHYVTDVEHSIYDRYNFQNFSSRVGAEVFYRQSAYGNSDFIKPTAYSVLRTSRNGSTDTSDRYYSGRYKVYVGGIVKYDMRTVTGTGNLLPTKSWFEDDHFGIFRPNFSNLQGFMKIPGFMKIAVHNKLLTKIDDNKVGLGHIVAELSETVQYVSQRTRTLAAFGNAILSGNWKRSLRRDFGITAKRWRKFHKKKDIKYLTLSGNLTAVAAARYLEFNFAILPSIKDLNRVIGLYKTPDLVLKQVKFKSTARKRIDDYISETETVSGVVHNRSKTLGGTISASCHYSIDDPQKIADKAFGINNVPASVYQGVPFSWLADYVVNIGEFLELITATEGLSFKHGYTSLSAYTDATTLRTKSSDGVYQGNPTWSRELTKGWGHQKGYIREPMGSFPRPLLRLTLPDWSLKRSANVVALGISLKHKAINAGMY